MPDQVEVSHAGTVALVREAGGEPETLLLRRSDKLAFAPGKWVFPGGRLEEHELAETGGEVEAAARIAAAREAQEECAQRPEPGRMRLLSHWTTSPGQARRFATHIFAAPVAGTAEVVVDGLEIMEGRWLGAARALDLHRRGELPMLPPTLITLGVMACFDTVEAFFEGIAELPVPRVHPVYRRRERGDVAMYPGDAGYASGEPDLPGPRHRVVFVDNHWVYAYEGVDPSIPPFIPGVRRENS